MEREEQVVDVVDWHGAMFPAPETFTRSLRKETGNERLEVFWDPTAPLFNGAAHPLYGDNAPHPAPFDKDHGCWTVYMRVRAPVTTTDAAGNEHQFSDEALVPILSMDGLQNAGLPFGLGQHVGMMLNASDYVHRGLILQRTKAAAQRLLYETEWARQESVSQDLGADRQLQRDYRRVRELVGITPTKEQLYNEAKKYERRFNLKKSRQQGDLKEMGL